MILLLSNLIYINLDGFGKYYFDLINDKTHNIPNIMSLVQDGCFFENAYTGIPSITYPMQCAIVSGCYSEQTTNCYQYFNRTTNTVEQLKRTNRAETIGEVLRKEQVPFVSIQQFALQDRGCTYNDKDYLYLQPAGNYKTRFDILIDLINTNKIVDGKDIYQYEKLPQALFLYIDDLDTIGHNPSYLMSDTENKRVANVIQRITEIDFELGRMVAALKKKNLYENTNILITTDHGMIPYSGRSSIGDLQQALRRMGYPKVVCLNEGESLKSEYDVLLTSHGIQCQIYFKEQGISFKQIKQLLLQYDFSETVLTKEELVENGVDERYADILISPPEGKHFCISQNCFSSLNASHDSLNPKCQQIFSLLKGVRIKNNYVEQKRVYNIDFLPTLCVLLDIPVMKSATGAFLSSILK